MSNSRFVLFKNKNKTQEKQPDMTGNIENANGEKTHFISGWFKTPENGGAKFISGELTSAAERAKYKKESSNATSNVEFSTPVATAMPKEEDDLPF